MIHSEELRRKRQQEAAELAAKAALKKWIRERNEELLGKFPNITGIHFHNRLESVAGELWFHPGEDVEIVPQYKKLDGETQPPAIEGTYKTEDASENDGESDPIVRITSKADKRIDKWHIRPSDEVLGEIFLDAFERKEPYPEHLRGKAKVSIPDALESDYRKAKDPNSSRGLSSNGIVPPPPPDPGQR